MGCFVHVILLGVGCFVSLQKNMWWFSSTYNKIDVGGYVRGVFCPYTIFLQHTLRARLFKLYKLRKSDSRRACLTNDFAHLRDDRARLREVCE